jgi:hypothetical protein
LMNSARWTSAVESYAGSPYLGTLTTDDLFARFRVLTVAGFDVTPDGKLEPTASPEWFDKQTHTIVEILRRDASLEDPRAEPDWSFLETAAFRAAVAAYQRRTLHWGDNVLAKYGSIEFLRPALERGTFRISPASYYNDPSLDVARRDAELERLLVDHTSELTATFGDIHDSISPEHRALYTRAVTSATDYYILCLAGCWQPRLFGDFNADACLVITDPARLPVTYFDPVQDLQFASDRSDLRFAPFVNKDFNYWYQKEVRAAWLPPDPKTLPTKLDHLIVTLGRPDEYCEILEL